MIAICGECLIDFIPKKNKSLSTTKTTKSIKKTKSVSRINLPLYQSYIGGSPLNTATAIARLNTPATIITRLSRDGFGKAIKQHFTTNGVHTGNICYGNEPSTIGFVIPPRNVNEGEDFVFYNEKSADRIIKPTDIQYPLAKTITHLHFSSIALQMEPCATTYEKIMKREYRTRTISLDPNVRALFTDDPIAYRKRIESWLPMTNVFRASDKDLALLYRTSSVNSLKKVMKKIVTKLRFPQIGILTFGQGGASLFYHTPNPKHGKQPQPSQATSKINEIMVKPLQIKNMVDTVGAGDSFTGAFLHKLYQYKLIGNRNNTIKTKNTKSELPPTESIDPSWLKQALEFAITSAGINCTREGCDPATLQEVKQLISKQSNHTHNL